jgi:hypothetical protein
VIVDKKQKVLLGIAVIVVVLLATLAFKSCEKAPPVSTPDIPVQSAPPVAVPVTPPVPVASPVVPPRTNVLPAPVQPVAAKKKATPPSAPPVAAPAPMAPPPVVLHKELIPKNIEIVRVYYSQMITGPDSKIPFDINGSGFTKEFQDMIKVEPGQPEVQVTDLSLVTPNQIHGTLVISPNSTTMVAFPRVLIQDKVVFQAPEPYAVIRPNEVLNLIFTEMGDNGRTGRFRIFTNLTQSSFQKLAVSVSTPAIRVTDLNASLPFLVDGTINIGPAVGGEYDIAVTLDKKIVWSRPGIIRVVRPNVGQSGLIQRVQPMDGFHRPGDKARFVIVGSGFQPDDIKTLSVAVPSLVITNSTFSYVAAGHLEVQIELPWTAPVQSYALTISNGADVLQNIPDAFRIVPRNWIRFVKLDPPLTPGGKSTLSLVGRDFDEKFVASLKVAVDDPGLKIEGFKYASVQNITAPISASAEVKPGDYLIHLTAGGAAVQPQFGSIIKVSAPPVPAAPPTNP